jgi:hypothetical protein
MINFSKPNTTLDWAAAHKFDQLFYAKYCSGKLTMQEYLDLIQIQALIQRDMEEANKPTT